MEEKRIKKKSNSRPHFYRQCFVTAAVSLNITAHGCVIGISAIIIPALRIPESQIKITPSSESWIASIIGLALIIGNIIITPLIGAWGRKKSHLLTVFPMLIGWFLLILAKSVGGIIAARLLQGISMGLLGPLGSIIVGEMTDPSNRGAFLTMVSLSLTVGVFFVHTLGSFLSWQQTALMCSFITFTSLLMILYTPESPPWLASKGRYEECREVFRWLRGNDPEDEDELEKMISGQIFVRKSSIKEKLTIKQRFNKKLRYIGETIKKKEFYKPIVIMLHVYTMAQFGGINVISSYATDVIREVVGETANIKVLMVALSIERLICNILAVFVTKFVKRRTLLFSTGTICVLSYLGKALYVYCKQNNLLPFDSQWIPISLIGIYMFSLAVGISSIPFTISGELFPLAYRGMGGGISSLALSFNLFLAVKCFPVLNHNIGIPLTYCLYGAVVGYCLTVVFFMLPETKDRTLQEIEDNFKGKAVHLEDQKATEPLRDDNTEDILRILAERRISAPIIY